MRNRRDRRDKNKLVLHITNRTIRGLPFPPKYFMNALIKGVLARGQRLYPVQVCHFQWMGNHYHLIVCGRASSISSFVGYFQGELAKYLRRITNHYQLKVWTGRFKEQRLKTAETVIKKIVYIYANPAKANLVKSVWDWPGISSFRMYIEGSNSFSARWLPSKHIKKAGNIDNIKSKDFYLFQKKHAQGIDIFRLTPNIWKNSFPDSIKWSDNEIREKILSRLIEREEELEQDRKSAKRGVIGAKRLTKQSIHKKYTSKSFSKTPYVESECKETLALAIESYKSFCLACKEAWEDIKNKVLKPNPYPNGAYLPGAPFLSYDSS